ncbi:3617_t:CDS:2 [Ambispora leptoticha]|uniref:3617_t:CDS:1 n=1 Tax=Ambispora leptoticha TaxID=144679 RepID=A0A9N9EHB4_9GLOM|nr:3617_t:CDS:2 [Ambispora leptoticha]
MGLGKIGDRDISEWDITEVDLYGIKLREIRLASKLGYNRDWDAKDINKVTFIMDYYRIGKLGLGKIGDRDISEWDITEVDLYGIKIREIRLASKLGYNRGWDTNEEI